MAIDKLQNKIRKMKTPLVLDLFMMEEHIPAVYRETSDSFLAAYTRYAFDLLDSLKEAVPAVRFHFAALSVYGPEGLRVLQELLSYARNLGFYVFMDMPEVLSKQGTKHMASVFFSKETAWQFDGLVVSAYIGSDGISPYASYLENSDKDLFIVARTSNRTAAEIQDLMTGARLVHMAMADIAYRYAPALVGRCGYSQIALVAGASSADSIRTLRTKYKDIFILLDGSDYPNANAKNCSNAFDRLGHGAIACVGFSVTAAWQTAENMQHLEAAAHAVERMKKNLMRYITIL